MKIIKFEGKIVLKEALGAKQLIGLLEYLTETEGFSIKKFKSDELELVKNELPNKLQAKTEIAKNNVSVKIEIEASDNDFEVEIKSESLELVKELTSQIAAKL